MENGVNRAADTLADLASQIRLFKRFNPLAFGHQAEAFIWARTDQALALPCGHTVKIHRAVQIDVDHKAETCTGVVWCPECESKVAERTLWPPLP